MSFGRLGSGQPTAIVFGVTDTPGQSTKLNQYKFQTLPGCNGMVEQFGLETGWSDQREIHNASGLMKQRK
jgi:hypothetical protein